jgi:predicted phosphodiesterase
MYLRPVSDLHLEFQQGAYGLDWDSFKVIPAMDNETEQTLVLAGDIIMLNQMHRFFKFFEDVSKRFKDVIVIAGNHEFYRYDFLMGYQDYEEFLSQFKNICLLQDTHGTDLRKPEKPLLIYGATLWTDFNRRDEDAMLYASNGMRDFDLIKYGGERWTPELSVRQHEQTVFNMKAFFKKNDNDKVIITHHLPSKQCNDPKFKGSLLNPAFSSDLDYIILEEKPKLWIFGHTHASIDMMIGDTRMVCNPRGYRDGEENPAYNPKLVIKI